MDHYRIEATETRKQRGAFFTHPLIAEFLTNWAVKSSDSHVLDPTCGEAVFLLAAGRRLTELGASPSDLDEQVYGVDINSASLWEATRLLEEAGLDARLIESDFFDIPGPDQSECPLPLVDAVVGNPPFLRYQIHAGRVRKVAAEAAMRQGVRLSGLASSWAPLLVHASSFLKPDGRLAIVLPAELLTVHYAEPIRRWLRRRFESVSLVMFERLQFAEALENVVLLLARGTGGCDAFSLYLVEDREDLIEVAFENYAVTPAAVGKWTDLVLPMSHRQVFRRVTEEAFHPLETYGIVGLGTVTGSNRFFALSEHTRQEFDLDPEHLLRISPPGTRHLTGTTFTKADWERLRTAGEPVWLLRPAVDHRSPPVARYIDHGERQGVHEAYKCQIRDPWWRPLVVAAPDLFFTYMSHRFPRLIANTARASFVNSMHGVWLRQRRGLKQALPLVALNSVTLVGAEVFGRSYGGGVLKMEPREAASLPIPGPEVLEQVWAILKPEAIALDRELRRGRWSTVLARVDQVLLRDVLKLDSEEADQLHGAARLLRERRLHRRLLAEDV
jgi:adenine-specific DNA-methyltransferase